MSGINRLRLPTLTARGGTKSACGFLDKMAS
jgi:hypothetical protein